jgi:hypothetical protein
VEYSDLAVFGIVGAGEQQHQCPEGIAFAAKAASKPLHHTH